MRITRFFVLFFVLSLAVITGCDENNNMLSQLQGAEEPPYFPSRNARGG